jgi:hypothetical protein
LVGRWRGGVSGGQNRGAGGLEAFRLFLMEQTKLDQGAFARGGIATKA